MFEKMTLQQYGDILADNTPTPGGGSALAVVGTIACALVEMSINVTLAKLQNTDEQFAYLGRSRNYFTRARQSLHQMSDDDARAFREIIDCMHLPQMTDEQIGTRKSQLQKAYHKAALVPLDVMRLCKECFVTAKIRVFPLLYNYVSSDCQIGIDLFANIVENSMENVYANTTLITDTALKEMLEKQGNEILHQLRMAREV